MVVGRVFPDRAKSSSKNKAVYTATEGACGWAGAVIKKGYSSDWAGAATQKPLVNAEKS